MRLLLLLSCLLMALPGAAQPHWCWDADEVIVSVRSDTVQIDHRAALLNCCPDPITFDIHVGDATIFVEEHSESPCDCECCYDLSVSFDDVPPGPWNLTFRWFDTEIWDWTERYFQFVVPDLGQPLSPYIAEQFSDDCVVPTEIPETFVPVSTWSRIKGLYR